MKCSKCGNEVGNNRFCTMCGQPVAENVERGAENAKATSAAAYVNRTVGEAKTTNYGQTMQKTTSQMPIQQTEESGNKNKGLIILVCALGSALVIALLVICLVVMQINSSDGETDDIQEAEETVVVEVPPVEEEEPFDRMSTYRPAYSYNRMPGIHNSYESDDATAKLLSDVITDYNDAWIAFVNDGNREVYRYVKSGTKAYENVESYGKKNLHEEFVLMDINDVRQTGSYYFVWTHEIIRVRDFDKGTVTEKEYYWVYRVNETGGSYYVEDYSYDPAYK